MRPDSTDQARALPDQKLTGSMQHEGCLLIHRLDRNKTHRRPLDGFADRLGIRCIILLTLHIGFDELRRHQANLMTKSRQLACPMVSRGTGFHADKCRFRGGEEINNLVPAKLALQTHLLRHINAMSLKYVLGQVQPDNL